MYIKLYIHIRRHTQIYIHEQPDTSMNKLHCQTREIWCLKNPSLNE